MFTNNEAFSSFSVDDLATARAFYGGTLGFEVADAEMGFFEIHLRGGAKVLVYGKEDHQPASHTVLNIAVPDIEQAVDGLLAAGLKMEHYEGFGLDEKGISRGFGPPIAWFTDPARNVIALMEKP